MKGKKGAVIWKKVIYSERTGTVITWKITEVMCHIYYRVGWPYGKVSERMEKQSNMGVQEKSEILYKQDKV